MSSVAERTDRATGRGLFTAIWLVAGLLIAGLAVLVVRYLVAGGDPHAAMPHSLDHGLFAAGAGPSGLSLLGSQFFTSWQLDASAVIALVLLAAAYTAGVVTWQRRQRRRWPVTRILAFLAGLLVIGFATCGSIAVYDQTLFSAHMIGHLALVMLAPALLVAGAPLTLWRETRPDPRGFDRVASGSVVTFLLSPPVAFACYTLVIVGTHLTGLMDLIMDSTVLGQLEHLAYLLIGLQFFVLVIGDEPIRWHLSLLGRLGILSVGMAVDTFTGVTLLMATVPVSMGMGVDAESDTATGGGIMWVGGDGLMAAIMVLLVVAYLRRPDRSVREENSWLERVRRGVFESNTGGSVAEQPSASPAADFDEDERRREAYNRWLARLHEH